MTCSYPIDESPCGKRVPAPAFAMLEIHVHVMVFESGLVVQETQMYHSGLLKVSMVESF